MSTEQRQLEALLARALDAVRCYDSRSNLVYELEDGLRQLASQPEAPTRPHCDEHAGWRSDCDRCTMPCQPEAPASVVERMRSLEAHTSEHGFSDPPEAPKEQADEDDGIDLPMPEARLVGTIKRTADLERDLAAANARIAELEKALEDERGWYEMWVAGCASEKAANARADAAERKTRAHHDFCAQQAAKLNAKLEAAERLVADQHSVTVALKTERDQLAQKLDAAERRAAYADQGWAMWEAEKPERERLAAERDQLAARVTELEQHEANARKLLVSNVERLTVALANQCTPEERQVLEACRLVPEDWLLDWRVNDTGVRRNIARAELANRAAKAKRGDK